MFLLLIISSCRQLGKIQPDSQRYERTRSESEGRGRMYASGRSQRLRARRMPIVGDKREPVPWKAASPPGAKDAASMERDHTRSRHSFRQATAHAFRRVPQFILGTRRLIPRETDTHRSRESSGELVAEANGKHPMPCHAMPCSCRRAAGDGDGGATLHAPHCSAFKPKTRTVLSLPCPALPCLRSIAYSGRNQSDRTY